MPAKYSLKRDKNGHINQITTALHGHDLLDNSRLNKGNAFTDQEREMFRLKGKLSYHVETLEQQVTRIYKQYSEFTKDTSKNIHLNNLHDTNETLFYKLVSEHLEEMLPIIYTPTVGKAVERFSLELRRPRGLYISYPDKNRIDDLLENRTNYNVDLIVVTDGEGVLGIGDQGIGGMNIAIAKLMVYVLCAGVNPHCKLPITLDVGTNNQKLLDDPMYLGWRHKRITGEEYDDFIDKFVTAVRKRFPHAYLHWEDFGRSHAHKNLSRYRENMLTFNDDIQGTGAVALAALLAGVNATGRKLTEERIVFLGAGSAGTGIADQMCDAMVRAGLTVKQAQDRFWLIDIDGLLTEDMKELTVFQQHYARKTSEISDWDYQTDYPKLLDVVKAVKPTVLIGCSTATGAFNEEIVREMAKHVEHPIIMPLSNPTSKAEAHPHDVLKWTDNKALVATGSPFGSVDVGGKSIRIAQCNNAFIFPGIGLGVIACQAKLLTDDMIWQASQTLSDCSPVFKDKTAPLLPDLAGIRDLSRKIAIAVINQARKEGVSGIDDDIDPEQAINTVAWEPQYYPYLSSK